MLLGVTVFPGEAAAKDGRGPPPGVGDDEGGILAPGGGGDGHALA